VLRCLTQDPRLGQRVVHRCDVLAFDIIASCYDTCFSNTTLLHRRDSFVLDLTGDVHPTLGTVLQFLFRDHLVSLTWVLLIYGLLRGTLHRRPFIAGNATSRDALKLEAVLALTEIFTSLIHHVCATPVF
jgi:hypothetical protein